MYNFDKMIYITSNTRNWISSLGMTGPIVHPIRVPVKVVSAMLMCGHNVQEYNPTTGQVVELTLSNFRDEDKFTQSESAEQRTSTTVYTEGVKKETAPEAPATPEVDWSSLSKAERKKMKRDMAASTPAEETKVEEAPVEPEAPVSTDTEKEEEK